MTDDEEKVIMLTRFHKTFKKHENAEPVANFVKFNKRYNALEEEFTKFMMSDDDSIGKNNSSIIVEMSEENRDDKEISDKIQEILELRDKSKDISFFAKFAEVYKEIPKIKKDILKYIKQKNLDDDFKGIVLTSLNGQKEKCEEYLKFLFIEIKKNK